MPDRSPQQLSLLAPHHNRLLFSDHFLNHRLPSMAGFGDEQVTSAAQRAMEEIGDLLAGWDPSGLNESQTEERVIKPILRILGHVYSVQVALRAPGTARFPDYILYPDQAALSAQPTDGPLGEEDLRSALAVADAKAWKVALDQPLKKQAHQLRVNENPSVQIDFYLRHSGLDWGILTNGHRWRLVSAESSKRLDVYYEVDLPALLEAGDVEAFKYFFCFFRQAAFTGREPWLDKVLGKSRLFEQGVSEGLRSQVFDALQALAQGFLDFPGNALGEDDASLQAVYDNSLIVLYRLLFVLYAESRGLLPVDESELYQRGYSLRAAVREIAEDLRRDRPAAKSVDELWRRLRGLWTILDKGNPELGVPAYNGGLFRDQAHPFLTEMAVGDHHLRQAIDQLARVNDPDTGRREYVDYRDLDVRHLGSIYEGLLEYRLRRASEPLSVGSSKGREVYQPADDPAEADIQPGQVYLVTDKGERKTTGSYYTPDAFVQHIVEHTLEPVLEAVRARYVDAEGRVDDEQALIDDLLAVNVLDPAMGSGHFLVAANDCIARFIVGLGLGWREDLGAAAELDYWRRRTVQACIYGVDLNPLAVELAKLSLWLSTVSRDRPLSFIDHHLRCGNSLVGARVRDLQARAPKRRRGRRTTEQQIEAGQFSMLDNPAFASQIGAAMHLMDQIEDLEGETLEEVEQAEQLYQQVRRKLTAKYRNLADLWTANHFGLDIDRAQWNAIVELSHKGSGFEVASLEQLETEAAALAEALRFFHWQLEFPEVFFDRHGRLTESSGFDAVIGNPPWERIKLQQNEFFASRAPSIARAPRAADRKRMIKALPATDPELHQEYQAADALARDTLSFVRDSGLYPLMGRGDTNLYMVMTELATELTQPAGQVGLLVPSGIATDKTTSHFFRAMVEQRRLAELLDFENRKGLFPEVHRSFKFSIFRLAGKGDPQPAARCAFFLHHLDDLSDPGRVFDLRPEDFRLFNPNTRTCPIFRSRRDYEITRKIYEAAPVLIEHDKGDAGNPWGVRFSTMFHMTNDSGHFKTAAELEEEGFWLGEGNVYSRGSDKYLPLYEGKMVHQYDHRYAETVASDERMINTQASEVVPVEVKSDTSFTSTPRYWVPSTSVPCEGGFQLGFRDITNATNVRTFIASFLPCYGASNKLPLIASEQAAAPLRLIANLNSMPFDYVVRNKLISTTMNFFLVEQFPVLAPEAYQTESFSEMAAAIDMKVIELSYTADDMRDFAAAVGFDRPPFTWDEERRFHLRCQLDAIYFHLYGLSRDEVDYVLGTFPIVKRQDEAKYGRFRTRDLVLAYYNAYAAGDMDAWVKG